MRFSWAGQSCFFLESSSGVRVLCDPYGSGLGYKNPFSLADVVTVSHEHSDHNALDGIKGDPALLNRPGQYEFRDVKIEGIPSFHDKNGGALRGSNIIFKIMMDNIAFVHFGDLGHMPGREQMARLKPCDIAAVPVGGVFTIDGHEAAELVRNLNAAAAVPMHYRTPSLNQVLEDETMFVSEFPEVINFRNWEGARKDLPANVTVCRMLALGELR